MSNPTTPTESIEDRAEQFLLHLKQSGPCDVFQAFAAFARAEIALDRISRGEGRVAADALREAALIAKNWHRIPGAFNRHPADEVADAILARAAELLRSSKEEENGT